jgi:hypothetical protein
LFFAAVTVLVSVRDCDPYYRPPVSLDEPEYQPLLRDAGYFRLLTDPFDPRWSSIKTLEDADRVILQRLDGKGSRERQIAHAIDEFLRVRFYHGYARYTPCDNWVSYAAGFVFSDFFHPVDAADLIKNPWAGCSQQSIVFQALLARHAIPYASVRIPKVHPEGPVHFAVGAYIDGRWTYYDAHEFPDNSQEVPLADMVSGRAAQKIYKGGRLGWYYEKSGEAGKIRVSDFNKHPGEKLLAFHQFTLLLSRYGWLVFGILSAPLWYLQKRIAARAGKPDRKPAGARPCEAAA